MKTTLGCGSHKTQAEEEAEEPNQSPSVDSDWFIFLLPTPTIWFSLVVSGVRRKWKRSDSSDSDSGALMTPIFDFHKVKGSLTIPTPSL